MDINQKSGRLMILTRERQGKRTELYLDKFFVQDGVENPEQALRAAIDEFLFTDDGQKMITYSGEDFNWGDAVNSTIEPFILKHGIERWDETDSYLVTGEVIHLTVNQDEILVEDKHLDEMGWDDE